MCSRMTKAQWLATNGPRHWPAAVVQLAEALYNGQDCAFALHDALLDVGQPYLANHFANPTEVHPGRRPGPGQCWVVALLRDKLKRRRMLLSTPAASDWLGIGAVQFRRLAERLGLKPEDWYRNPNRRSGPRCPLWAPEDIVAISTEAVATLQARRDRLRPPSEPATERC